MAPERVNDLLEGKGAQYVLAAELNHYPGPSHILEYAAQLQLWGALPLGSFLGAVLADALGLTFMFAIMGLIPVLVAMVAMRHPALQKSVEPAAAPKAA